ncbi:unnamed protein product [Brachionus calyciflorus]|uniref:Uncharacterized protein n=1 Tax=Brachionus calyciflorus TaxID=104777 RepID=A0A813M0B1_9BILA|nr:unnamed protein product [Brachionus calyciflorus]
MKNNFIINKNELIIDAARRKDLSNLKKYLESPCCSLNFSDKDGLNALHLATLNNDLEMVKYLVENKADVNSRSNLNRTPLHYACLNGFYELAKYLLENNSEINAVDFLEMTPLHLCAEKNHINIARLLCRSKNINVKLSDKFNRTSYNIACSNKNQELINILNDLINDLNRIPQDDTKATSDTDLNASLAEFYKKKSFARPLNKSTKLTIADFYENGSLAQEKNSNKNEPCCSNFNINKPKHMSNIMLDDESSSDEEIGNFGDVYKKKRLSTSPLNFIESHLNWMTNQSNLDLSKFELSLTEAGKLAMNYLNKNDPIEDENRILMKLINEFENTDETRQKNSQDEDESLNDDQELQNKFLNMIENTNENIDESLKFFDNFSFYEPQ